MVRDSIMEHSKPFHAYRDHIQICAAYKDNIWHLHSLSTHRFFKVR